VCALGAAVALSTQNGTCNAQFLTNTPQWLVGLNGERLTDIAVLGGPGGPLSGIIKPVSVLSLLGF
jgi:hypothetical protein